ncbi:MAG TPA: type I 3-dehydroquinate dehydratase [Chthoniobacteraceae bacterium]|jgi:3-dehydroquinate dehydratase-1
MWQQSAPLVVGTIYSPGSLRQALRLKPDDVDVLELRIDHFADDPLALERAVPGLSQPRIVTVRHAHEGGAAKLTWQQRAELYRALLPHAAYIDVELRSAERLRDVCNEARAAGVAIIISHHDFRRTPSLEVMRELRDRAASLGADLFKIAAHANAAPDLSRLLALLGGQKAAHNSHSPGRRSSSRTLGTSLPLSVMGMGPLGKISRLLFACTGSRLNYGYLDKPQVSGQWEATLLKKRLAEVAG